MTMFWHVDNMKISHKSQKRIFYDDGVPQDKVPKMRSENKFFRGKSIIIWVWTWTIEIQER